MNRKLSVREVAELRAAAAAASLGNNYIQDLTPPPPPPPPFVDTRTTMEKYTDALTDHLNN